jgi:hypothetical protein
MARSRRPSDISVVPRLRFESLRFGRRPREQLGPSGPAGELSQWRLLMPADNGVTPVGAVEIGGEH